MTKSIYTRQEIDTLHASQRLQIINARLGHRGLVGHSYFHKNPAVSSDLILFLRYSLPPGGDHGRPLSVHENGFWIVDDQYPGADWRLPETERSR